MAKAISQDVTDRLYVLCQNLGYDVYTYNPPADVPYPFIVVNRADTQLNTTKTSLKGRFFCWLHIWGDEAFDVNEASDAVMSTLFMEKIKLTNDSTIKLDANASNVRAMDEPELNLYRNILELEFYQL